MVISFSSIEVCYLIFCAKFATVLKKNVISLFLIVCALQFSIDLHGISHVFDNDADKDHSCEICVITSQSQNKVADYQEISEAVPKPFSVTRVKTQHYTYRSILISWSLDHCLLKRPPPFIS